ncbi:MAG: right-handed parallel beta-helix repeat-containing protein [Hyphomicrobiales bacterium]|nr:MAG: right-handed parallel beta-helix repeat-containing protein [Hyphomicrobiales bacterium]
MDLDRRSLWVASAATVAAMADKQTRPATTGGVDGLTVTAGFVGARSRSVQDRALDSISVTDAEGVSTRDAHDSTDGFNLATGASDGYSPSLARGISVPSGTFRVGGGNASVFVRKGQTLAGAGLGATTLDMTGARNNSQPTLHLGRSSQYDDDPGGQAVELTSMTMLGGPDAHPCVSVGAAGWSIHDVFFSAPGIGIAAGGADGLIQRCIFDLGLNHIVATARNTLLSGNLHYLGSYQITIGENCADVTVSGCLFEYFRFAAILLAEGAKNIRNVAISDCNFKQNEQHGGTHGAIYIRSSGSDLTISGSRFRNINGFGVAYGQGVGNKMFVNNCVFDGQKTVELYNQSKSMGGIDASNTEAKIQGCIFRELPGQPIRLGGDIAATWVIQGCHFAGNSGGASEIEITNTNPRSRVVVMGCTGSGRPLVNEQAIVPVTIIGCDGGMPLPP